MRKLRTITGGLLILASAGWSAAVSAQLDEPANKMALSAEQSITISGNVELYPGDVRLLTNGIEIQLVGAAEVVIPHGGLWVSVTGRFVGKDVFQVSGLVAPGKSEPASADGSAG
jgi:hypothetical protein